MDVSRTIQKMGAKEVTVIYRRSKKQMPAEAKEVEDAKRQLTWFRKNKQTIWLNGLDELQNNLKIILEEYK